MDAMVLKEFGGIEKKPLQSEQISIPKVGKNEVLLKIEACGVCHTDLHEVEHEITPELPIVPGHEIIGVVEKKGDGVKDHQVGDRLGLAWLHWACGECKYCKQGLDNLCENAEFTGFDVNGGYAEYIKAPARYAFPIPDVFESVNAAPLMCAGIIGYRSLVLSSIKKGGSLGLFGFGASAHIAIQVANYWGCKVYVFTRSENHQKHAWELGAEWVGTSKDSPPKKLDSAITFAPVGEVALDALKKLDKGGTLAINAIYLTDIPAISWNNLYHERKITSVANFTRKDALEFLDIAGKIPIKTTTTPYRLSEANNALIDLKNSNLNGAAVLDLNM